MLRILLGTVLGAIVFFMWGAMAWMVLQLHDGTMHTLDNEQRVKQALRSEISEPGVYWFPGWPEGFEEAHGEHREALMEQWKDAHRAGPIGFMVFHPDGFEPMPPETHLRGLGLNACMALIASVLLWLTGLRMYVARVLLVASLGVLIALAADMIYWNYMHFPLDYTVMMAVDRVIGWTLAGLVIGAVVRPVKKP